VEESYRPGYDEDTKTLIEEPIKIESFYAVQYIASKYMTLGLLYNYYLLREWALTATVFF
jgi:hypothetical protein